MEEKQVNEAHWSATPVKVDAAVLMASLLEALCEAQKERDAQPREGVAR